VLEYAILASQNEPFDPMERAIKEYGEKNLSNTEHLHGRDWVLVKEYPLSRNLLALSHVWKTTDGKDYVIAAKGAPEAIIDLCHLDAAQKSALIEKVSFLSNEGLRVIGVAKASFTKESLPSDHHAFIFEFIGLVGFEDPVRPEVASSVAECYSAGMRVIMITGDFPGTAVNVARQAGFSDYEQVITGPELDGMEDKTLSEKIKTVSIFARVVPEQKLRIVNALKANKEIVIMTGDGVNDAPALKAAHIGIAMGGRGTEVARESAALVLLDDDFSSIIAAARIGRRIYDNIKKALSYVISVHVPIAGMSLLPVLFNSPLALFPVHIAFLQLIIDPVCSVVFEAEPEEKNIMRRRPRRWDEPLFDRETLIVSVIQGLIILAVVAAAFWIALSRGHTPENARAIAFLTLVIANLALILSKRSWDRTFFETLREKNTALWNVIIINISLMALVLYVPFLMQLFSFAPLHLNDLVICFTGGIASIIWFEAFKVVRRKTKKKSM
jgi:Ca2+-transporting ATPase